MAPKQPTIYDVAKLAGVSPATVSRAINSPSMVNPAKKEKIMQAIAELNFVPKAEAVAKARRQLMKIAVIAPFFTESSFMERLKGIASILSDHHYELVIYAVQSSEGLQDYVDLLVGSKRVDGLISLCMNLEESTIEKLRNSEVPVCFVETEVEGFDSVVIRNAEGGRLAASFLYENGYRTPGYIGEASLRSYAARSTEQRLDGFVSYYAGKGISLEARNIWLGENLPDVSNAGIMKMLNRPDRPDCIFASSDTLAIRTIKCAVQLGIIVPDDLGVVGFDDIEMAEFVNLTTINQSLEQSGVLAAEMILQRIKEPRRAPRKSLIDLKLIKRSSTEYL
ncbi:LacI family DNA-binding transcriptional regulator [Sphaerochaeta sp. PS]|uniref:LacI family DNA-binding transcriptional regulator n=1 Tax=Sphaerochaeta sp. PS TaxID=3076336 RepID=UPI0028A3E6D6|nr:LacI family DNA-binding transcriptional regulator [Sphaerochaeta sp. PS]MDT4762261.1 LacI family DNA-binding transcriptional regulator [Sphaerochaeta sp. PS]